jgi:histidyl-tRNA synthetase
MAEEKKGCFIVALGENTKIESLKLTSKLRQNGIRAESIPEKSFKTQMRQAGKSGYPVCFIIGDDEMANGTVAMKDMNTGVQEQVKNEDLINRINMILKGE